MRVAGRNLPKMPLSSSWFTDFQPRNTRNTRTGSREKALFVFVYLACFAVIISVPVSVLVLVY
jgi:ABC-type phosphate transport system permease subunit